MDTVGLILLFFISRHCWLSFAVLLCLAAPVARADAPNPASETPTTAVQLGAADWAPYFYGGRSDGPPGSAVEIFEICLPPLGYTPEFIPATVDEVFSGLRSGRFQVHVLSYRAERESFLTYGDEPMFYSGYRPFVRPGLKLEDNGPEALDGLRLAHRRGMKYSKSFDAYMSRRMAGGDVLVVESDTEGLQAVADGRIDAVPLMLSTALHHRRRLGLESRVEVLLDFDLKTAGYRVAVAKNQNVIDDVAAFLQGVDACLRQIKEDGRYQEIGERYADLGD